MAHKGLQASSDASPASSRSRRTHTTVPRSQTQKKVDQPPPNVQPVVAPSTPSHQQTRWWPMALNHEMEALDLGSSRPPSPRTPSSPSKSRSAAASSPAVAATRSIPRPVLATPLAVETLHPVPGGVSRSQRVIRNVSADDMLWPVMPAGYLLTIAAANDWQNRRAAQGINTSSGDHAAARARQNDFIVDIMDHQGPDTPLFNALYEKNHQIRNELATRLIRDLRCSLYSLELQTDCLAIAFVVSPHANPALFERVDENDATVVRVVDPADIKFKYAHRPLTHRVGRQLRPDLKKSHEELATWIKEVFAKPHLENWGRRRAAAGHIGTLSGSLQPFAEDNSDDDQESDGDDSDGYDSDPDGRLSHARRVAAMFEHDGEAPRLPELIVRMTRGETEQLEVATTLATLDAPAALQELLNKGFEELPAIELVKCMAIDKQEGYPLDLLVANPP